MKKIINIILIFLSYKIMANKHHDDYVIDYTHVAHEIYGDPKLEVGKKLSNWNRKDGNPQEQGSYFQGDILIPSPMPRSGIANIAFRWEDGIVPYEISGDFVQNELDLIQEAIDLYHRETCIRFVLRENETDYIDIINTFTGCWSGVGRIGNKQEVNIQSPQCTWELGTIVHELMHVLGFFHEQSRWDRDDHVKINWKNIDQGQCGNFARQNRDMTDNFGVPYDYDSIMHYSQSAFSINEFPTIIPDPPLTIEETRRMGKGSSLSFMDVLKIKRMYNC